MKQILFAWHEPSASEKPSEVVLNSKTIETVVALMARALIAVLRAAEQAEEAADER